MDLAVLLHAALLHAKGSVKQRRFLKRCRDQAAIASSMSVSSTQCDSNTYSLLTVSLLKTKLISHQIHFQTKFTL